MWCDTVFQAIQPWPDRLYRKVFRDLQINNWGYTRSTGSTIMARNEDVVCLGFGNTTHDDSNTDLGYE
jgi:hypothetical protein